MNIAFDCPSDGKRKRRTTKRNFTPSEHSEQVSLMQWAAMSSGKWPELRLMYAIPNAAKRSPILAARMKAEGLKAGVPDLHLPVPRGTHHGLYIEMKRKQGARLSDEQKDWLRDLNAQGYRAERCRGWQEARDVIVEYLEAA